MNHFQAGSEALLLNFATFHCTHHCHNIIITFGACIFLVFVLKILYKTRVPDRVRWCVSSSFAKKLNESCCLLSSLSILFSTQKRVTSFSSSFPQENCMSWKNLFTCRILSFLVSSGCFWVCLILQVVMMLKSLGSVTFDWLNVVGCWAAEMRLDATERWNKLPTYFLLLIFLFVDVLTLVLDSFFCVDYFLAVITLL